MTQQAIQNNSEDKTYENEVQEVIQLKNIIDSKEAAITALKSVIDELKLAKVQAVEEAKKEADNLMVNHICKNEKELNELKESMNQSLSNKFERLHKEEKKKRQEAEGELTIIKGIGNSSPEMNKLKEENDKLTKELKEVKHDNKKLAQQITDLKKEAKDMLLYP